MRFGGKLIHIGATAGIRRLDQVKATLDYAPITTDVMMLAAELWASSAEQRVADGSARSAGWRLHPRGRKLSARLA